MCDYSLEGYPSVNATVGAEYKLDGRYLHGFITKDSDMRRGPVVTACVVEGQKLKLTKLAIPYFSVATETTVTVRQRKYHCTDARYLNAFGMVSPRTNDFIELEDGTIFPIALIHFCDMSVLPAEKPKAKKRNLAKLLGLDKKHEAALQEIDALTRGRVDAD